MPVSIVIVHKRPHFLHLWDPSLLDHLAHFDLRLRQIHHFEVAINVKLVCIRRIVRATTIVIRARLLHGCELLHLGLRLVHHLRSNCAFEARLPVLKLLLHARSKCVRSVR